MDIVSNIYYSTTIKRSFHKIYFIDQIIINLIGKHSSFTSPFFFLMQVGTKTILIRKKQPNLYEHLETPTIVLMYNSMLLLPKHLFCHKLILV